jgi:hypothetical protein
MPCCGVHCHHGCWAQPYYLPAYPRYAPPPRQDYARALEEERDLLEQRLRRLERELEELRRAAGSAEQSA